MKNKSLQTNFAKSEGRSLYKRLEIYLARFVEWMQVQGWSIRTVADYRCEVKFFITFLQNETSINNLHEIDSKVLTGYQTYLYHYKIKTKNSKEERRFTLGTQHKKIVALRTFFRFLYENDVLMYNPSATLKLPKKRKSLPKGVMNEKEIEKLLESPDTTDRLGIRDKAILELLYSTGIRNSELRNLTIYDIDLSGLQLTVREGKNSKDRTVPIGEIAADYIKEYLQMVRSKLSIDPEEDILFLSKNGRRLTEGNLIWIVSKYVKLAKLNGHYTPHSLRHSCATHMLKYGADIRYIKEMLGHASIATTQIYTKVEVGDLKNIHRRFHPREKLMTDDQ